MQQRGSNYGTINAYLVHFASLFRLSERDVVSKSRMGSLHKTWQTPDRENVSGSRLRWTGRAANAHHTDGRIIEMRFNLSFRA